MTAAPKPPAEHDLELLSAYLDGELTTRESEALEQRLAHERALHTVLEELRATITALRELPHLKAPRNFTLDPAIYERRTPWWQRWFTFKNALQLTGALGTAASLTIITLAVLLSQDTQSKQTRDYAHAPEVGMAITRPAVAAAQAMEPVTTAAQAFAEQSLDADSATVASEGLTPGEIASDDVFSTGTDTAADAAAPAELQSVPPPAPALNAISEQEDNLGEAAMDTSDITPTPLATTTLESAAREEQAGETNTVKTPTAAYQNSITIESTEALTASPTGTPTAISVEIAQAQPTHDAPETEPKEYQKHTTVDNTTRNFQQIIGLGLMTLFISGMVFIMGRRRAQPR